MVWWTPTTCAPRQVEQIRSIGARALEFEVSPDAVGSKAVTSINGYAVAQSDDVAQIQREMLTPHVAGADVVITAASVPGRPSPLLVTAEMVDAMEAGSVLVDLAAERGGNCEVTEADVKVECDGVTILGPDRSGFQMRPPRQRDVLPKSCGVPDLSRPRR